MGKKSPITLSPPPWHVKGFRNSDRHVSLLPPLPRSCNNPAYGMNSHWNVTVDSDSQITIRNRFGLNKIIKVIYIYYLRRFNIFKSSHLYRYWTFQLCKLLHVCYPLMLLSVL